MEKSEITQGYNDSQNTNCTAFARKHSEKCLNCVLCLVPGQTRTSVDDPNKLNLSCIEILPTFKATKQV